MATSVRILKSPPDGRRHRAGETVTLPDPVGAKLVASGCAEVIGRAASASFSMMVDCFRKDGKGPAAPAKRAAAPLPKVSVRLKGAADESLRSIPRAAQTRDRPPRAGGRCRAVRRISGTSPGVRRAGPSPGDAPRRDTR